MILERNDFNNFESLCHFDDSRQVSAQSDLRFRRRCLKNFKLVAIAAILDIRTERFSNSESLCHCDASHQVLAQSDLRFGRRFRFEEFQDGRHGGHLAYRNGTNLAILNLCVTVMPPIKFQLNRTRFWRRCRLKNIHLGYRNGTILAILNLHVATMPPTKFQLNPTYCSGGDVEKVKS